MQGRDPREAREMEEGCRTSRHVTVWTGIQQREGKRGALKAEGGGPSVSTFLSLSPFLPPSFFLLSWPAAARETEIRKRYKTRGDGRGKNGAIRKSMYGAESDEGLHLHIGVGVGGGGGL